MAYLQELIRPLAWYTVIRLVNKTNTRPGNAIFRHDIWGVCKSKIFFYRRCHRRWDSDAAYCPSHLTTSPMKVMDVILIVLSQSTTLCAQKSLDPGGYPRGNLEVPLVIMKLIVSLKTLRWTVKCLTSFAHSVPVEETEMIYSKVHNSANYLRGSEVFLLVTLMGAIPDPRVLTKTALCNMPQAIKKCIS